MKHSMRSVCVAALAALGFLLVGCGVNKQQVADAEARIDSLLAKGVPDSMLTYARVAASEARGLLAAGESGGAAMSLDTVLKIVTRVEQWFASGQAQLKPELDAKRAEFGKQNEQLTGPQRKVGDSLLAIADNILAKGMFLQARQALLVCDTVFGILATDEVRMKEVLEKLPGFWGMQEENKELGVVRTKKIAFKADNTFTLGEEMKGKTADDLKEDWRFTSGGTWSVKGDTVFMHVTREKREKMELQRLVNGAWKKEVKPPYDSTFTDGHKDAMIEFKYMQESMKKVK